MVIKMNIRRSKLAAAVMTAVFILSDISVSALPSKEWSQKDYRLMNIISEQGQEIQKPTARFAAKRIAEGEVQDSVLSYADYDCTAEFPTLTCYVGDTLAFEDMSYDNCGGKISEWDWQYYGTLGDSYKVYKNNIVESTSFELTKPGVTMFYLCVKSDVKVKTGSCDPWSDNGNHQTVGRNKWFPKGAYWYFTAIRVVVKPARDAVVHVRYKNARDGSIIKTEDIPLGRLQDNKTPDEMMDSLNFSDDEKNWANLMYDTLNDQYLDPDGGFADKSPSYDGAMLGAEGETQVVYYSQLDSRWADKAYGKSGTIGGSGCGPTSLAIAVSTITGQNTDPTEVAAWSAKNGYRREGNGSYYSLIPKGAEHYGLNVEKFGRRTVLGSVVEDFFKIYCNLCKSRV